MLFDARAAKSLKPGDHIIFDGCPGLRLEASASRFTWTYRYRSPVDGRMRQISIGHWPAKSPAAAEVDWEGLRRQRDAGADPALQKKAQRAAEVVAKAVPADNVYRVRHLVSHYIEEHIKSHRKPKGAAEVERLLTKELGRIEEQEAGTVTRKQAFELLQAVAKKGPVIAAQIRGELGAAWDHALDAGRLPEESANWWRQILRGKLRSKGKKIAGEHIGAGKRFLKDPEAGQLINWLPNFTELIADALTLYMWTMTRGAESLAMQKEEITEEADGLWWTIPKAKTKNARIELATDHRVPLVGRAAQVVRKRMAAVPEGYLFPTFTKEGEYTHVQQKTIQSTVHYYQPYSATRPKENRPRLTVTHWSPHDLRRTGRTMIAAMGCPREVGEALLGHVLPGVEGTYNRHMYDRERRDWLTRLDAHLEKLAKQELK